MRRRDWLAWFLVSVLAGMALAAWSFARDVGHPFGGYLEENVVLWDNRIQVMSLSPSWWPNVRDYNLRPHGLLAIDGQPYIPHTDEKFAAAVAAGHTTVTILLDRGGPQEERLPIQFFTWSQWLDMKVPYLIISLSLWLLAVLVYTARPTAPLNRVTAWLFGWLAALFGWGFASVFAYRDALAFACIFIFLPTWPFLAAALIHFSLRFPAPSRALKRPLMVSLYAFAALITLVNGLAHLALWNWGWADWIGDVDAFAFTWGVKYLTPAAIAIWAARMLWLMWQSRARPALQRQMGVVLLGLLVTAPFLFNYFRQMYGVRFVDYARGGLDTRYLFIAVPLAFTFIILRHKTFRAAHPLFLAVFVMASSGLLAAIGVWLRQRLSPIPLTEPMLEAFLPIFIPTLFIGFFWSTQTVWRGWFGRLFQRDTRDFVSARQFSQRLIGVTDPATLAARLAEEWREQLQAERTALWLSPAAGEPTADGVDESLPWASAAGLWAAPLPTRLARAGLQRPTWLNADEALFAAGGNLLVPLIAAGHTAGYVLLGPPREEEVWEARDTEVMELLAQQSALLWFNARQIEDLRRVSTQLADAQRAERFRIAQDLHDTVQQRLGGLQPLLETSVELMGQDLHQAAALVERSMSELDHIAQTLRRIRQDLTPPDSALTLRTGLEQLGAEWQGRHALPLTLDWARADEPALPPAVRHELLLIVAEALVNVARHAQATRATVRVEGTGARWAVSVVDDGRGFTPEQSAAAQAAGSFGLRSMRARAETISATLTIDSTPEGTRLGVMSNG